MQSTLQGQKVDQWLPGDRRGEEGEEQEGGFIKELEEIFGDVGYIHHLYCRVDFKDIHMGQNFKLYTLNICSSLCVNGTS